MRKIIYYYNGKKIVGTKDSRLETFQVGGCEEVRYLIDGIEVSEYIYREVKKAIKSWEV
ncbi:hypothetical protein PM10SUCC1_21240 [Propionigenium maris DSM 9537]|uniref:Uncharacterized protein n=1 Tax=Propionigenium maris DSM 9537 TaxID=1123000 RepID=A0A9W6GME5_9FUSO|nr:hypothetical protein [Propionigenium maris]GLI56610.1 hypothetical protein PM10SUCC1_21240 [Propionigenium maris DSM 9537]